MYRVFVYTLHFVECLVQGHTRVVIIGGVELVM